jgi:aryl-alcohol dehydrogenase-like predicted oxidoreductase
MKSLLSRHRQLAPTAAIYVSPLCLGSMNFGDAWKDRLGECSKGTSFEILDQFFQKGGNFIDTANAYHYGETETWLGEWMQSRGNRDQIVLATKYTGLYNMQDPRVQIRCNTQGNGSKSLRLSVDSSLLRLQTGYIDLLYVHWWDYTASIPEVMHSLNDLVVSGKVLYLGISDCPAWVVSKANQYARDHGLRQFVAYQGMWNASLHDVERDILPMCRAEGMAICAYGALGQGEFQTKAGFSEREKSKEGRKQGSASNRHKQVSKVLEDLADFKQTTITNVALAYVRQKAPYVFPVVGGRKLEHIKANIDGLSVSLTDEEITQVESAHAWDPGFPHTFLSGTLLKGTDEPQKMASRASEVWLTAMHGTFDWVEDPKAIPTPSS